MKNENREIKFRGMSMINEAWIYGHYAKCVLYPDSHSNHFIFVDNNYGIVINPRTLGQYTGLNDIDGNEVYEGDIVENPLYEDNAGRLAKVGADHFEIKWSPDECVLYGENIGSKTGHLGLIDLYECKVIGNIYKNPELLNVTPS